MYYRLGLVGHPVSHSLSPPMHEAALAHYGLAGEYKLIDLSAQQLARLRELSASGFVGLNVTVPHKQAVLQYLTDLSDEARQLGAVNAISLADNGRMIGHNTDMGGFVLALTESWQAPLAGRAACVLGAGGAARAAVWGLSSLGWPEVRIVARNKQAASTLTAELLAHKPLFQPSIVYAAVDDRFDQPADLVVNCTPVGLADSVVPDWMADLIKHVRPDGLVFDMVYSKTGKETPIVRLAGSCGKRAVDGLPMLVNQAALAFSIWTGRPGPYDVMLSAARRSAEAST